MYYYKRFIFSFYLSIATCYGNIFAQELMCNVTVNAEQVQTQDRRVFQDMEVAFTEFLNDRKWTDDSYKENERIVGNIVITINEMPSIGNFSATVQVQSARPVYGASYETVTFNFADRDWTFSYVESQPLNFNENTFTNNITSLLAFYAYVLIGIDYDTFKSLGGKVHFDKAYLVVTNAQQSNYIGWQQSGSNRNRFWLIDGYRNQRLSPVREAYYKYHRLGLDKFSEDNDKSREIILEALKDVQKANKARPNSIAVISFFDAKKDEIVDIFSKGEMRVRREAYYIVSKLDPSNKDDYEVMIK